MSTYRRVALIFSIVFLLIWALAACAADDQAQEREDDSFTHTGVRAPEERDVRYPRTDGDNNYSRQNPNIRVGDPTPRTVSADARRMEQAAENVDGVEDATVVILGGNALVRIDLAPHVARSRAPAIEEEVARQLFDIVPRYEFRVSSDERLFNHLSTDEGNLAA